MYIILSFFEEEWDGNGGGEGVRSQARNSKFLAILKPWDKMFSPSFVGKNKFWE